MYRRAQKQIMVNFDMTFYLSFSQVLYKKPEMDEYSSYQLNADSLLRGNGVFSMLVNGRLKDERRWALKLH
jgi:hypothetical protein